MSDVRFATTQFDWPVSSGNFDVTIPDLGWAPKAFKITVLGGSINETPYAGASIGIGYATATDQRACSTIAVDGLAPLSDTWRTQAATVCARKVTSGAAIRSLQSVAPILNGWTINALNSSPEVTKCIIEFYGGEDLEAEVGTWIPTSEAGPGTYSGVAFNPNYVEVSNIGHSGLDVTTSHGILSTGYAYNNSGTVEQAALVGSTGQDGVAGYSGALLLTDSSVTGQMLWSGLTWERGITNFVANGWEYSGTGPSSGDSTYYFALNTGTTKMSVRVIDSPDSTLTDWSVTGLGFKPQGLKISTTALEAADVGVPNLGAASGLFGHSACDHARACSVGLSLELAAIPTNTSSVAALKSSYILNTDDSVLYDVGAPVFTSDGWTVPSASINNVALTPTKWVAVALGLSYAELTGNLSTTALGTLGVSTPKTLDLVGVSGYTQTGNLGVTESASALAGTETTIHLGSLGITESGSTILTGLSSPIQLGSLGLSIPSSTLLTGLSSSIHLGSLGITESGSTILTGLSSSIQLGSLGITESGSTLLTGLSSSIHLGSLGITESGSTILTGLSSSIQLGSLGLSIPSSTLLTGLSGSIHLGSLGITESGSTILTGLSSSIQLGSLGITESGSTLLTGLSSSIHLGSLGITESGSTILTGISSGVSSGTVGTYSTYGVSLTGIEIDTYIDSLGILSNSTVGLTGLLSPVLLSPIYVPQEPKIRTVITRIVIIERPTHLSIT